MRDTIARQSDVDKSSVKMDVEPGDHKYRIGIITFAAKKDKSLDLEKIYAAINATRLSGRTNSAVKYLEITATGEVVAAEKKTLLKVSGTTQQFVLGDDPSAKPKNNGKTPFQKLQEALAKGKKVESVTGRVQGWSGRWPEVLRALSAEPAKEVKGADKAAAKEPPLLMVTDFQIAKE